MTQENRRNYWAAWLIMLSAAVVGVVVSVAINELGDRSRQMQIDELKRSVERELQRQFEDAVRRAANETVSNNQFEEFLHANPSLHLPPR
jgi:DNA integrity scanning protein DisA with diadenylate cyclase activity